MLARLFAATSLTALLLTGAAYAQNSSSSGEVILPKKNQTQDAQQPKATDGQQQDMTKSGNDSAQSGAGNTTQQQADDGSGQVQKKKKTQAQSGSGTADSDQSQQQATDKKSTKQDTQQQATDKKSTTEDSQQQATDQNATKKKQANDATGSTSKVEITTEKRKVIREKLVTTNVHKIERSQINFDINVGVAVPSTIVLQPLPATVVEVVPQYQGYDYFVLADGTIIIVDPGTHEIVYVLAA